MNGQRLSWFVIPVLNTLFQIFIKLAADAVGGGHDSGWFSGSLASPWFLAAVAVEIACFLTWMQVLSELDLSKAFPLSALSYVLVVLSSWLYFREQITALQLIGSALILGGVWLIGTASGHGSQSTHEIKFPPVTTNASQTMK
jgi:drug/metabolite transporter (DMT)-like permease